jgi:hypothetical protein
MMTDTISFKFKWIKKITKSLNISSNEMIGLEVWYQPTDSMGKVISTENGLAIQWEDQDEVTYLDTDEGREVLRECKPF